MTQTTASFLPILILLIAAVGVGALILVLSGLVLPRFLKPRNPQPGKLTPYECGVPLLQESARRRYGVKFYLVAMLFILFDVEAVFLFPWARLFGELGWAGFAEMGLFLLVLVIGWLYALRKGALEWE
jgi:NADH-quinone oxidoreductase subunit A